MRQIFLFISILSLLSCTHYDFENITSEEEWLDYLCSQECRGRKSGTIGSLNAFKYIVSELEHLGYYPIVDEFCHSDGTLLRNITIHIEGKSDSLIVIGAHYDGQYESSHEAHYPAANDNASGVVSLMSFLRKGYFKNLYYSLDICFWDGEEAIIQPPFKGSLYYVNNTQTNIKVYINCDTVGFGDDLYMKFSKYSENLMGVLDSRYVGDQVNNHILLVDTFASDDYSFYSAKIPTIGITDGSFSFLIPHYPIHTIYDTMGKISTAKLNHVTNIIQSIVTKLN